MVLNKRMILALCDFIVALAKKLHQAKTVTKRVSQESYAAPF